MSESQGFFNVFTHVASPSKSAAVEVKKLCEPRISSANSHFDWSDFINRVKARTDTLLTMSRVSDSQKTVPYEAETADAAAGDVVKEVLEYLRSELQVVFTETEATSITHAVTAVLANLERKEKDRKNQESLSPAREFQFRIGNLFHPTVANTPSKPTVANTPLEPTGDFETECKILYFISNDNLPERFITHL
ncbi:hypothetical protein BGZ89_005664, partial [Linnemannia elongata]